MDVRKLLKVYNVVNDERKHRINLKFAGALVAFVLSGALLVGFFMAEHGDDAAGPGTGQAATQTEYVGVEPDQPADAATVDALWREWQAEHPDACVLKREPVTAAGVLIGYRVTYEEPCTRSGSAATGSGAT